MVIKWPFMSHKFSFFFLTKLQKTKSKLEAKKYVFDQIEMLKNRVGPLKMTVRSSVLWKLLMQLAKKWPETVLKFPTPRVVRFISDQSLLVLWILHERFVIPCTFICLFKGVTKLLNSNNSCYTPSIVRNEIILCIEFQICHLKSLN